VSSLSTHLVFVSNELLKIYFVDLDLDPDLISSTLDLIVFFGQGVSSEGMFTML
jgi:hypothetical protein